MKAIAITRTAAEGSNIPFLTEPVARGTTCWLKRRPFLSTRWIPKYAPDLTPILRACWVGMPARWSAPAAAANSS